MVRKKNDKSWHAVPLSASFMVTAILGFVISVFWVYPQSETYGFSFALVFVLMFIAGMISMTKAPVSE